MKSFISFLGIALIVVVGVFLYKLDIDRERLGDSNSPSGFERYTSEELGFSILKPAGVEVVREGPNNEVAKLSYIGPNSLPQTEITDGFTVSVRRDSTASTSTLSGYLDERFSSIVETSGPLDSEPELVTLGEYETYKLSYQGLVGGRIREHILIENGHAYSITYAIADPNALGYEEKVETMLDSFRVN